MFRRQLYQAQIANSIMGSAFSWASYWAHQTSLLLFFGETSKITGGRLYNQMSGSSDYMTVAGSPGSYTFQCPNNATYIAADTDYIWLDPDTQQRTVTESELINYDFLRTLIKYQDISPYSLEWVAILKLGQSINNNLRDSFHLSIWWNNVLSSYGYVKGNRGIGWSTRIVDTFTDADNTLLENHKSNIPADASSGWTAFGSMKILSNTVYGVNTTTNSYYKSLEANIDFQINVTIPASDNYWAGITLRWSASNLCIQCGLNRGSGGTPRVLLFAQPSTTLGSYDIIHSPGTVYKIRVVANSNSIKVYINGGSSPIIDTTSSLNLTIKNVGIFNYRATSFPAVYMDNFVVNSRG